MTESYDHRNKFTRAEDQKLLLLIGETGPRKWKAIARRMPGKTSRQCRDRYMNYLRDGIVNSKWTDEEDRLLIEKVKEIGTHWSRLTHFFCGRSANNLKNRWYTVHFKRRNQGKSTTNSNDMFNHISNFQQINNTSDVNSLANATNSIDSNTNLNNIPSYQSISNFADTKNIPNFFNAYSLNNLSGINNMNGLQTINNFHIHHSQNIPKTSHQNLISNPNKQLEIESSSLHSSPNYEPFIEQLNRQTNLINCHTNCRALCQVNCPINNYSYNHSNTQFNNHTNIQPLIPQLNHVFVNLLNEPRMKQPVFINHKMKSMPQSCVDTQTFENCPKIVRNDDLLNSKCLRNEVVCDNQRIPEIQSESKKHCLPEVTSICESIGCKYDSTSFLGQLQTSPSIITNLDIMCRNRNV
ncbi:hypothetical protein TRFO_28849 [Tritrichomonas foetus]|uniref:Myb-like DNA-binding domain containing protein n=1 Tax=Tritrichomonas foetus TaxID=1144522 RepID=A0A1J4JWZ1_9EUKA|nr:hypothetical protein TRFO_28849 [Tritrichomonas foetus]|eukprot:OHT03665.1 hypothetical protein TRFO_28849 [Tritrichomonas foetus]